MKSLYLAGLLIFFVTDWVNAQEDCPYDRFIADAQVLAKAGKTKQAESKFKSAITCRPWMAPEIAKMIHDMLPNSEPDSIRGGITARPLGSQTPGPERPTIVDKHFVAQNRDLISKLSHEDSVNFMEDVARLHDLKQQGSIDSLEAFFRLVYKEKSNYSTYLLYDRQNALFKTTARFPEAQVRALSLYSFGQLDAAYYSGLLDLELAGKLVPAGLINKYRPRVESLMRTMESRRRASLLGYLMPDTVIGFPSDHLFAGSSSGNRNFAWGYVDYGDYKKVQVRYLNMSLPDFVVTTDSSVSLRDSGMFYSMSATSGDYRYCVGRGIDFQVKPNLVEFRRIGWSDPSVERLLDKDRKVFFELTGYASNSFFFSPDGSHLSGWKDGFELAVLDIDKKQRVPLKNARPAPTETFTPDSKKIAYYNDSTRIIYISDLSGNILEEIPGGLTGIDGISNIDFTGDDAFLKVNNDDSVSLFDIRRRKMLARFSKDLVTDIVVSPDRKEILLTCKSTIQINSESHRSSLGIVTDTALNIKGRLYADCNSFFFTPDGRYIVGVGEAHIMRWPAAGQGSVMKAPACISPEELAREKCLPLSGWAKIVNADLLESGVRAFVDMAEEEHDSMLQQVYYKESARLIYELALGNARLKRWERVPFFYAWYNWVEWQMGHRDFGNQFVRQFTAVREFDKLVNTRDSGYPQQLYYAAEANLLLENLYDSMRMYNADFIEVAEKEIALRYRVFEKDPENVASTDLFIKAFKRLSAVCDTVGRRDMLKGRYSQRLAVYRAEARLLESGMSTLPDSFGLKMMYINTLAHLGPSFLYQYASHGDQSEAAADSAVYYSERGLSLSPVPYDSARLLIVEACAYMLEPEGSERCMALCRQVRHSYPHSSARMLNELTYLRESGAKRTSAMEKVEEFLRTEEK